MCVIWVGDFNYEPTGVGATSDPSVIRKLAWNTAVTKYGMVLLNPSGRNQDTIETKLSLQERTVHVRDSSTFVYGGRGIDCMLISTIGSGMARMIIHNGRHCRKHGCERQWCNEVAFSDHCLCELVLTVPRANVRMVGDIESRPRMPRGMHDPVAWCERLQPFMVLVDILGELLQPVGEDWDRRARSRGSRQTEADAVAKC